MILLLLLFPGDDDTKSEEGESIGCELQLFQDSKRYSQVRDGGPTPKEPGRSRADCKRLAIDGWRFAGG